MAGEIKVLQFAELTSVVPPTPGPIQGGVPAATDDVIRVKDLHTFDVVVYSGVDLYKTHSTFAAGCAALAANQRMLVLSSESLAASATISVNGCEVVFARGITLTDSGANTGLIVSGDDCIVRMGRWATFSGGGDIAISNTGDRNRYYDINFNACNTFLGTEGVSDSGTKVYTSGLISE